MILRELLTTFGFDVDTKGLDKFDRAIRSAQISLLAIGGAITGAATGLFALVKNVGNIGEEIKNSSQELGLSTDALQEWRYAADQAGISNEDLATSIRMFSRNVGQAATNATGPFVDRLAQLGIKLTDANGKLKDNDTLLLEVANSLSTVKDAQLKGAIAQEFFGRSGLRMASWLSSGSEEINLLRERARELGLVLDNDAIKSAESFNNLLSDVIAVIQALKNEIGVTLMPLVRELAEAFLFWVKINREFLKQRIVAFFEDTVKYAGYLAAAVKVLIDGFEWLVKQLGSVEKAIIAVVATILLVKLAPLIYMVGLLTLGLWRFFAGLLAAEGGLLLIPIAITLFVTALALAAQELLAFFGVIDEGDKLTPFEALKKAGIAVIGVFLALRAIGIIKWLWSLAAAAGAVGAGATSILLPFLAFLAVVAAVAYAGYQIYKIFKDMLGPFTWVEKFQAAWIYVKAWLGSFFNSLGDWLGEKFDRLIGGFVDKIKWLKDQIASLNPFNEDKSKPGVLGQPLSFSQEGYANTKLGKVRQFFEGVAGESQALAAAPAMVPQQILRTGNNTTSTVTNNKPVNITSNVNVTMPPGVSSVNQEEVTAAVRAAWNEDLQKMLETAHYNNAEHE